MDWFEAGFLPGFRLNGSAVRYSDCELVDWLESQRVGPLPRTREDCRVRSLVTEPLVDRRRLAALLGVSPDTVSDWFQAGKLPGFKLNGRVVRFRVSEVLSWLETQRAASYQRRLELVGSRKSGAGAPRPTSTSAPARTRLDRAC